MKTALFGFFLLAVSFVLAFLEIQIEGKAGWAGNLPCWRVEKGWFVRWIWGGRPLTGYHTWLLTLLLLFLHFPLVFTAWGWRHEALVWGFFMAMWPIEDFLWFVLNPAFGIRKFRKGMISWHKDWCGPVPMCYLFYVGSCVPLIYYGAQALRK